MSKINFLKLSNLKRFVVVFLVFSLVIFSAGCRRKTPAVAPKNYNGVELTYYKLYDDADVMVDLIRQFELKYPGLKVNYKKFSDYDEYMKTVLDEMAEGEGPDIFSMQNTWFASNYKKIVPMPQNLGTPNDFALTFVDVAYKDLVLPDEAGNLQVYGLPMTVDSLALYYNKAHFEDRLPATGRPSITWQGIKEDVKKLNKTNSSFSRFEVAGLAMGSGSSITKATDIIYLLFLQHGVNFYGKDLLDANFASDPEGIVDLPAQAALELFLSFADDSKDNYSWNDFVIEGAPQKELEAFALGKVSMIVGYAFTYQEILNQINVLKAAGKDTILPSDIRTAQMPQVIDPATSTQKRVTYANYFAESVSRNTDQPQLAWEFLLFITGKEPLTDYFAELKRPASRRDMIEDQKVDPIYGTFASQAGYAESFPIVDYRGYQRVFDDMLVSISNGEFIVSALSKAQSQISLLLNEK